MQISSHITTRPATQGIPQLTIGAQVRIRACAVVDEEYVGLRGTVTEQVSPVLWGIHLHGGQPHVGTIDLPSHALIVLEGGAL